jgi:hypothetical protein
MLPGQKPLDDTGRSDFYAAQSGDISGMEQVKSRWRNGEAPGKANTVADRAKASPVNLVPPPGVPK